ncbi:MAG: twin-arginine translocation signal domain-containing protein, partial [Raoultibacter sp.]
MTKQTKMTRRTFFGGAAALGAAAMLGGCAPKKLEETKDAAPAQDVIEVKHAWCKMCGPARTHCSTLCTIKNGRWTNVEGNPDGCNNFGRGSKTLCAKGNSAMQ